MKNTLHIIGLVLLAGAATVVFAQDNVLIVDTLTNIPELTSEGSANNLPDFLQNLYRYGIGIAAILAVVMITYGGFQYMMSEVPGARTAKRQQIVQAIFGLILVLLPFIVFSIINPQILNLDPGFERAAFERREVNFGGPEECGPPFPLAGGTRIKLFEFRSTSISSEREQLRRSHLSRCCTEQVFPDGACEIDRDITTLSHRDAVTKTEVYCDCSQVGIEPITGYFWKARVQVEYTNINNQTQTIPAYGPIELGPYETQEQCQQSLTEETFTQAVTDREAERRTFNGEIISVLASSAPDINCEYEEREVTN